MKTTLYRPIGLGELNLIIKSNYKAYPPRLEWQPIFYPVLNKEYAEQIAYKWNINDEFSGYCGIVTEFAIPTTYFEQYEVHNVGGFIHNELWDPSSDLDTFNKEIIDGIKIASVFFGDKFDETTSAPATLAVIKYKQK